jgi:hypothetical protein
MTRQEQAQRYPLSWPVGWKRTPAGARQRARFAQKKTNYHTRADGSRYTSSQTLELSVAVAARRLEDELARLGADAPILSTNLVLRLDGGPRSDQREPEDPGAAVYFRFQGQPRTLACDRWPRVADNIAALAAHIEAIRAVDRYGVGTLEQAFAGYAALPSSTEDWWLVLEVTPDATLDDVETAFKRLARVHHPDVGGAPEQMVRLTAARDLARKVLGCAS